MSVLALLGSVMQQQKATPVMPHGHFAWNELNSNNVEAAKTFYGEALGWVFEEIDTGEHAPYTLCKAGDAVVAGIFPLKGSPIEGLFEHWFSYVEVDDVDQRVADALQRGAVLQRPVFDVQGFARLAIVKDPNGAVLGWMTSVTTSKS